MIRTALFATCFALAAHASADEPKAAKVEFVVHTGHFEKNNAGLKDNPSFLTLTSAEAFDKVFGVAFTMGKKPNVVTKGAFEKHLVIATIKRGNFITNYDVEKVTLADGTLTVAYKTTDEAGGTATFASPLIVSVPKAGVENVEFVENGKKAGTAEVK
jgi:hypothetical protein